MYVTNCSEIMKRFFVNQDVTWKDIEDKIILPYLSIVENESLSEDQVAKELSDIGLTKGGMGAYGVSKACVNSYTLELSKRFPLMLINSCTPGFVETDLTRPWAERSGKTPQEMGMIAPE